MVTKDGSAEPLHPGAGAGGRAGEDGLAGEDRLAGEDGRLLRADLHTHTHHSPDARNGPAELVERAREAGLERVAVTDHGEVEGALRARELDPELVVVGEEIRCACRTELIGLFLRERIPPGLPLEETVERIRDQGGVVHVPHPFAYLLRPGRRGRRTLARADAVEAVNARAFLPAWNGRARREAERRGLPVLAGSDAHFPGELGRAYTLMPPFRDAASFLRALPRARPVLRRTTGPGAHLASVACKLTTLGGGELRRWWEKANAPLPLPFPREMDPARR